MPRLSQWYVKLSFGYLLLGFSFGALLLAHKGQPLHPALWNWLPAHIEWLKKGYADGLFLASGRRIPRTGGVILAKCDSRETLQARLSQDPFQQLGLARTEIIPFEASMASPALQSLL